VKRLAGSSAGWWATVTCGAFAAASAAGHAMGVAALWTVPIGLGACGALLITAGIAWKPRAGASLLVAIAAVAGFARGVSAVETPGPGRVDGHLGTRPVAVIGSVQQVDGSFDAVVASGRVIDGEGETSVTGGLLAAGPNLPPVAPGDSVEVDASGLRAPGKRAGAESQAVLEREGVQAIAVAPQMTVLAHGAPSPGRAIAWLQQRLVSGVNAVIPQPAAALVLGIAFGIRQPLAADVRASLQDAGLIHIVVVSGLKVVMVIGMVAAIAALREWSRARTLAVSIPVIAFYVLLSGSGPAALRSALMAGAAMTAGIRGRRTDPVPMLALVAAAMLAVEPALSGDVGFQLSFLGTAGILVMAAPLARRLRGPRVLVEPFAVTVAAQLATIPVMAKSFGVLALGGPIANAFVLPLLPAMIVVGGGGALLGAISPPLGWLPLHLASIGADLTAIAGKAIAAIPGAAVRIGFWPASWSAAEVAGLAAASLAAALLLAGDRRISRRSLRHTAAPQTGRATVAVVAMIGVAAAGLALVVNGRPDGRLHVTLLDTGSAPAVLVRASDGGLALIDGGSDAPLLVQALGRVLPPTTTRIDMVVLTGGERAAAAALAGLPGHYDVTSVVEPGALTPGGNAALTALQQSGADIVESGGRTWSWGGATWRCLDFRAAVSDRSMCAVRVVDASGRLLVLGDAGTADQEEITAVYGSSLGADLLVTEPGGAVSPLLIAAARPHELAVPVAKGGLTAAPPGVPASRTGRDGDLSFDGGPQGLVAAT